MKCFISVLFLVFSNLIMENDILIESPVKKSAPRNNFHIPPAKITEMNNLFNSEMGKVAQEQYEVVGFIKSPQKSAKIVGVCSKKLKRGSRKGEPCGKSVYKYGICSYHWGIWKKNNPFLKHP
jgi:hypothetical protein